MTERCDKSTRSTRSCCATDGAGNGRRGMETVEIRTINSNEVMLVDADGGMVGKINMRTGRAIMADSFWVRERTCEMIPNADETVCTVQHVFPGGGAVEMDFGYSRCSECGSHVADSPTLRFCPVCGARVIEEEI